jgi:hypothetical protein
MKKKIFNLRNVVAIAICLAATTVFSGCNNGDPDGPDDIFDGKITGLIVNYTDYDIAAIKVTDSSEEWTITTTPVQNGIFTIALPASVEDSRLGNFDEVLDVLTVSDPNTGQVSIGVAAGDLSAYDSADGNIGRVACYSDDELTGVATIMYVDRNCKVTGNMAVERGTVTYNLDMKKGWNVVYYVINANGNVEYTTVKSGKELKWWLSDGTITPIDPIHTVAGHISGDCTDVSEVRFYYGYDGSEDEAYYVTAPVNIEENNLFVIELPNNLDSKLLYPLAEDAPTTIELSDVNTFIGNGDFYVIYPGYEPYDLYYFTRSGEAMGVFMYADRPCNVTGHDEDDMRFELKLSKGWNTVYFIDYGDYEEVTTTQPDMEFEWIQESVYPISYQRLSGKGRIFSNRHLSK